MRQNPAFIKDLLKKRILVLDGAMGTMLQASGLSPEDFNKDAFANHPVPLAGDNDVLNITRPDAVTAVHRAYLDAGADIIETNTFNSTPISQTRYGLQDRAFDLAKAGAANARAAADEAMTGTPGRICLVAGSVGPTGKTASISPSVDDPAARDVTFDELAASYQVQMEGLIEGGVDIILIETIFDTLNAKAALYAADIAMERLGIDIPVMVSATLSDASGRMLAGQCAEAFLYSVMHGRTLLSVGFNCALGASEMRPHIAELAAKSPFFVSAHPNAGLPDAFGNYVQTPEKMAEVIRSFAEDGLLNIVGGCCGTTPAHIAAIAKAVKGIPPRRAASPAPALRLSGLDPFVNDGTKNFINIGERTNVAGSRKFLRLVKSGDMREAMAVALHQIENGASVIDVNMDDPMLDPADAMKHFLLYAASEPEIARVPVMIDSSDWKVVQTALRCVQGRSIVNSISLKEGEKPFIEKAREIRRLGGAVLAMAFDEQGQADTLDRRISVLSRSYDLLTEKAGIPPEDIVFDPNVFAVATGIPEHDGYAADFIAAVKILHEKYPACGISGGISNVSFSFRGNEPVRSALHTVFLKHAIDSGLTMGIVNSAQLGLYDGLDPVLRKAAEDVILNSDPAAGERLLELASKIASGKHAENDPGAQESGRVPEWRKLPLHERIAHSLTAGDDSFVKLDMTEALASFDSPMKIVEGPLMDGMAEVGKRFSEGRMFLPQVVKSARVMKASVSELMPAIENAKRNGGGERRRKTAVIATVKGDVHDIGKNIVSVVLQCNDCRVVDLGVMVPASKIIDSAVAENADIIGLSGLITPSLAEMAAVVSELEKRSLSIPVIVGGAACSKLHTAIKLAPLCSFPVVYVSDASAAVPVAAALTNPEKRATFAASVAAEYAKLRCSADSQAPSKKYIPLEEAQANAATHVINNIPPLKTGVFDFSFSPLALERFIDWRGFVKSWSMPRSCGCSSELIADAKRMLESTKMNIRCVCGIFPAASENGDIIVYTGEDRSSERLRINTLRSQKRGGAYNSTADNVASVSSGVPDWIGMLVCSVSGADSEAAAFKEKGDDYSALLAATLGVRLAEAAAEMTHMKLRRQLWGYETSPAVPPEELIAGNYRGIRPAPGYPDLPDHSLKREIFSLLDAEKFTGAHLTQSYMMSPEASVCALCIAAPAAAYSFVDGVGEDQLKVYASKRGMSVEDVKRLTGF